MRNLILSVCLLASACASPSLAAMGKVGVCAHVTRDQEFGGLHRVFELMREAGFDAVRSDFDWRVCQKEKGSPMDFTRFDHVVDDAAKYGIRVLPILADAPQWALPLHEHLDEWRFFVREMARHFKGRISVFEIWNEENISAFWHNPDPLHYAQVLKAAHEEIKAVDPSIRVAFGGTAGCDVGFIEKTIRAGARQSFDIIAIHPYCQPHSADPVLKTNLTDLRKMMSRNGISDRSIWITEMGWPTHCAKIPETRELQTGLKIAEPERKVWQASYVTLATPTPTDRQFAEALREILPSGSTCVAVSPKELIERLKQKAFDLVVYPFTESYPDETIEAVFDFVKEGGTIAVFGGFPFYFACREGRYLGQSAPEGEKARARFRIGVAAWWFNSRMPETTRTFPSQEAKEVGLSVDPAGLPAGRFFSTWRLKEGDRLIPILVGKDRNGEEIVGAGVYQYGDLRGNVLVSCRGKVSDSISEETQGERIVEAMKIAFAEGVERYFIYELQAIENNPYESEHHFGIVHKDFLPKPAYEACRRYLKGDLMERK